MKNRKNLVVVFCLGLVLCFITWFAYMKFVSVPKITLSDGTVVDGFSVKDSQGFSGEGDQEFLAQDREMAHIFKNFTFVPVSDNPKQNELMLFPVVREEIRKQKEFDSVYSEQDIHDVCLTLGQVIASDSGRTREDHEKDLSYTKPLPLQSSAFTGEQATWSPAEQFKFCYDSKLAENPRLVGMCVQGGSRMVIIPGRHTVADDLAIGFTQVVSPPGFYLTVTSISDAYIFYRDTHFEELMKQNIRVTTLSCSIPVKDGVGNMYPLNITVYKNPLNKHWWVHRAQRTVNIAVQQSNHWPVIR